ncbi:MAG: GDP-L-fucose synthase [Candidatus Nanoarchaeia archaeon]
MDPSFWKGKKVVVTGGAGFLGKHIINRLKDTQADIFVPRSKIYDLRDKECAFIALRDADIVLHLAAVVGGIGFNIDNPGKIYYDNVMINTNTLEAARINAVKKFVGISSACAYPLEAPVPLKEEYLFTGRPEPTNEAYGFSKLMLIVQSQAYRKQYGMNIITPVLFNMYGPYDDFKPETSHVIPAMIKKYLEQRHVVNFGDGSPSRSFLFVEDAAEGIILAAEKYDSPEPVNIGSDEEIKIKDLADLIARLTNFKGTVEWDNSKPGGQPRRCADTSKAYKLFGFKAKTSLEEGLRKTIEWYKNERKSNLGHT